MAKPYELLTLTQNNDAVFEQMNTTVKEILTQNGAEVTNEEDYGTRELAYDINDVSNGHYNLIHFNAEPAAILEIEKQLKLEDDLMRYMIVNREFELKKKEQEKKLQGVKPS